MSKKSPKLITSYLEKSKKRTNTDLSPVEQERKSKKLNKRMTDMDQQNTQEPCEMEGKSEENNLKKLLLPLINKVDQLREVVDHKYTELEDTITSQKQVMTLELQKLESTITTQRDELKKSITQQIRENNSKVEQVLTENGWLKLENDSLKERLDRIELAQLNNNIIITGVHEQPWENYATTKQRVYDTIASTLRGSSTMNALDEAKKIDISYCMRIGRYRPDNSRPISVTFQKRRIRNSCFEIKEIFHLVFMSMKNTQ